MKQQGVIAGRVPAPHRQRVVEDRALLANVEEDLDEGQVGVLVRHLGHRVGVHVVRLAEMHIGVAVEDRVPHEVQPSTEVLGLLRHAEVLGQTYLGKTPLR